MKYIKTNLVGILNGVSLPVSMQHDITYKISERVQNNNSSSYIYENEWMKMKTLSWMIKYLPCVLVNFQAAIYASLLFAKCS